MDQELFDKVYATIARKESTYDGIYYTGVLTTRIVCRPSCRAKTPKPANIRLFRSLEAALDAGFRPCKRCKPEENGALAPDAALTAQIDAWLEEHYGERVTLDRLAAACSVSPYHLQRVYKRCTGRSPAQRLCALRLDHAVRLLAEGRMALAEIGQTIGYSGAAQFSAWFRKQTGLTPQAYRSRHISGGISS